MTRLEAFWAKVNRRGPDDCWPWIGARMSGGYGEFWDGRRVVLAHRWIFEQMIGPVPAGRDIGHTCHDQDATCQGGRSCPHRPCVNYVKHLAPQTLSMNTGDGLSGRARGAQQRAKTHCPAGHSYDEANTYYVRSRGYLTRQCRACARERARLRRLHTSGHLS
jgi:hypothetical protein